MSKELINSDKFFRILQDGYKGIIEKPNINFWEDFSNESESGVVFKNIEITEAIDIYSYYSFYKKITFIGSIIPYFKITSKNVRDLVLIDSNIDNLILEDNVSIRKLSLQNNSEIKNISIDKSANIEELSLFNDSYFDKINIKNQSKIKRILVNNSRINDLKIDSSSITQFEVINKSKINDLIFLNKAKLNELSFDESTTDDIVINSSEIKQININKCKSKDLIIDNLTKIENIRLCESVSKGVDVLNASEVLIFNIVDKSKIGDFNLHKSNVNAFEVLGFSKIGTFNSSNSTVEKFKLNMSISEDINIDKDSNIKNFIIENFSKSGNILFREADIRKLEMETSLSKDVTFIKTKSKSTQISIKYTIIGNLTLFEGEYDEINLSTCYIGKFKLDKIEIKKDIKVLDDSKVWNLWIQGEKNKKIFLKNSYIQKLNWNQETICMLSINECSIEDFLFEQTAIPKDSVFQISDSSVKLFKCSIFVNTAWFNISNLQPLKNYKRFEEENNSEGELAPKINISTEKSTTYYEFKDILKAETTIHLENSDMGKTSFVDCRLNQFDNFIYYNTKMLEVYVGGTQLPTKIILPTKIKDKEQEQKEQERLAFGQFKKIYDNRGDSVSASEYLALELDAYTKQNITWSERFNLKLNKYSSNYGNNWWKATKVTILVNSVFFFIYCMLLGYSLGTDWRKALELASYSFEYLNPLRKADFIDTSKSELKPALNFENIKWIARFWDYFSRIVIAYFVYQTIQAFRRFGKTK